MKVKQTDKQVSGKDHKTDVKFFKKSVDTYYLEWYIIRAVGKQLGFLMRNSMNIQQQIDGIPSSDI